MSGDINSRTVEGLLAYCEYLTERGYAGSSQVEPWKSAIRKVFSTVEGTEEFEGVSLADFDVDDYMSRFEVKARGQLKHESLTAYVRRVRNALEAYEHFLTHGRPPSFRQVSKRPKSDEPKVATTMKSHAPKDKPDSDPTGDTPGMLDHVFPLNSGQVARLRLPQRLDKADAERLVLFLRALQFEPQGQIPERTGQAA